MSLELLDGRINAERRFLTGMVIRHVAKERLLSPKRPYPALHRKRAPSGLDLRILGEGESILHVDSQVANRILDLAMAEQDLNGAKVACSPVDY